MLKWMKFYYLLEIYPSNIKKQLLDAGLYSLKTDSQKTVHKIG